MLEVDIAHAFQVGNLVAGLEGGDAVVHVAQVFLQELQPLFDEAGRSGRKLVFLINPHLVIDLDDGVEYGFGLTGGLVGISQVDDGGLLVVDAGLEAALDVFGCGEYLPLAQFALGAAGYFGQYLERGELPLHIGYVDALLHQPQVAQFIAYAAHAGILALALLLDQQGGLTGVHVGGGGQVVASPAHADEQGEDKPVPV